MFEPIDEEEVSNNSMIQQVEAGLGVSSGNPKDKGIGTTGITSLRCQDQLTKLDTLAQNLGLLEQNWSSFITDPEGFNKNKNKNKVVDVDKDVKKPLYIGNVPYSTAIAPEEDMNYNHGTGVTRNFACTKCPHRLSDILSLKSHLWANHNSLLEHILCPSCGKSFDSVPEMNAHYKSTHGSICQICSATFESVNLLKEHMGTVHSINQSWMCSVCPANEMVFFFNQEYINHMKIHQCTLVRSNKSTGGFVTSSYTGSDPNPQPPDFKPRPTPALNNYNATSSNYKASGGGGPPSHSKNASYKCPECIKVFTTMDGINQHRATKHGSGPMSSKLRPGGPGAQLPKLKSCFYGEKVAISDANAAPIIRNPRARHFTPQSQPRGYQSASSSGLRSAFGATPSMLKLLGQYQTQSSYSGYQTQASYGDYSNSYSTSYQHLQSQGPSTSSSGTARNDFFNYFDPTPGGRTSSTRSTNSNSTNLIYNPLVEARSDYYDAHPVLKRSQPQPAAAPVPLLKQSQTAAPVGYGQAYPPPPLPPSNGTSNTNVNVGKATTTYQYGYGF